MIDALKELNNMLQHHDWYYQMSDDSRAYNKGRCEWQAIEQQVRDLAVQGYELEAKALVDLYSK
jgi:hypothetical protein